MISSSISRLGYLLRKTRVDMNINQKTMAKKLGISASYLSAIETGKRSVTGKTAEDIRSMLLNFHSPEEINMAILMTHNIIEFKMPPSDPKKKLLVMLSMNISRLSDGQASDLTTHIANETACRELSSTCGMETLSTAQS